MNIWKKILKVSESAIFVEQVFYYTEDLKSKLYNECSVIQKMNTDSFNDV